MALILERGTPAEVEPVTHLCYEALLHTPPSWRTFVFISRRITTHTMPINRQKKSEILAGLEASLKDAKSVVFVNFKGLKVNDANKLRRQLDKEKVGYTVAKKTLISKVLDARGFTGEKPALDGEVAIAYSEDLLAAPREIHSFAKTNKGTMSVLGGIFDGAYAGKDKVLQLASIPPMQTLRAQFVNLINSPIQRFVIAASEIAKKKS